MSSSTFFAATMLAEHSGSRGHNSSRVDEALHHEEDGRATSRKRRWGRPTVLSLAALTCLRAVLYNSFSMSFGHLLLRHTPDPLHFLLPRKVFVDTRLGSTFIIATLGTIVTGFPLFVDSILFWHQVADEEIYPDIPSSKPLSQLMPRSMAPPVRVILWECLLILAGPIGLFLYSVFDSEPDDTLGVVGLLLAAMVGRWTVLAVRWAYARWRHSRAPVRTGVDAELPHFHPDVRSGDAMQPDEAAAVEEGLGRK